MALDSAHPLFSTFLTDWKLCRHSYRGERVVKERGLEYLPATSGMNADGMHPTTAPGYLAYEAYKTRAVFHDFLTQAVRNLIGLMWSKPPTIELPAAMEGMRGNATNRNETLMQLLRNINEQQLITGRLGLLLDVMTDTTDLPYIAMYNAEAIINWDDGSRSQVDKDSLNLVVLDESEYVRNSNFEWELKEKHRVMIIGETAANESSGKYSVGVFDEKTSNYTEENMTVPSIRGATLDQIPFTFINSKDIVATPDDPPLLGLARLGMTIYRGEADYRQSLFLQGQDTLVVIGGSDDENHRTGAGAALNLPTGGDAKYIGVDSTGLSEQRSALENDKMTASNKSGELTDTRSKDKESGDALRTRSSAQTATLNSIALSGAEGLQQILRIAALWMGADPEEVIVTPNLDFVNEEMAGRSLVELVTAKTLGAPISNETIHMNMQNKSLTDKTFEEELSAIDTEVPLGLLGTDAGGDEDNKEVE